MSNNYPYRRPPSDSDLRPGSRHRASAADGDFYRPPQESFSSSYLSASSSSSASQSSAALQAASCPQDGVLSILNSCGLEPADLALLAKLPEDVLTVESLPHILKQIKGKRGTVKPFPPTASSPSSPAHRPSHSPASSSAHRPSASPSSSAHRPSSSSASSSAHRPSPSSASRDWNQLRSQPVQYPLNLNQSTAPPESLQDRWWTPSPGGSVRPAPPSSSSSSSSRHVTDYDHRPSASDYGKTGPVPSCSPAGPAPRPRPARVSDPGRSDYRTAPPLGEQQAGPYRTAPPLGEQQAGPYRTAPPLGEQQAGPREARHDSRLSSKSSWAAMPSRKQALDFHGMSPPMYPYSCSLCDITVLSERVWIQHINGTIHADGQLSLLQKFPNWDCRMETINRDVDQSERRKDEEGPAPRAHRANQSQTAPSKKQQKAAEKGRVVCAKFPAQSVDEAYLRKLTEPFGKIVKMLMFPSLAFVELDSVDQAKDLVKYHSNNPPTVNGEKIEFSMSTAFLFLQSSRVLSFSPAPKGGDGCSDLIGVVKRFGEPLYTLFLPSKAFLEMKNPSDAQKLVEYYSSNTLKINGEAISVSFSAEYKTLMRVSTAKRYEEEPVTAKRARSSSSSSKESSRDHKTRSRDEFGREKRTRTRSKSRSRDESGKEKRTRTRSKSRSRDESGKEKRTRTRSKSRSRDESGKEKRTRTRSKSRSRDESGKEKRTRTRSKSRSRDKSGKEERTRTKSGSSFSRQNQSAESIEKPGSSSAGGLQTATEPHVAEEEHLEEEDQSSEEESDIEGMEVIAEDGQNVDEEDAEESSCPEERVNSPEREELKNTDQEKPGMEEEGGSDQKEDGGSDLKEIEGGSDQKEEMEEEGGSDLKEEMEGGSDPKEESGMKQQSEESEEDEAEPEFPVDLDSCITLDEVEADDHDEDHQDQNSESESSRVVFFSTLPLRFTDVELIKLMGGFGTVVRYLLIRQRRQGFVEMSSTSEALRAARELDTKPVSINGSRLLGGLSCKYDRLENGWDVPSDEKRSERRRSERLSKSGSSDPDPTSRGRRESSRKTRERKSEPEPCEREAEPRSPPDTDSTRRNPKRKAGSGKSPGKRKGNPESDAVPQKSPKTEPEEKAESKQEAEEPMDGTHTSSEVCSETKTSGPERKDSTSPEQPEPEEEKAESKQVAEEPMAGTHTSSEVCSETKTSGPERKDSTSPEQPEPEEEKAESKQVAEEPMDGTHTSSEVCSETKTSGPERKDSTSQEQPEEEKAESKQVAEEPMDGTHTSSEVCSETKTSRPERKDSTSPEQPEPPGQDSEPQSEPAEGAAEPEKPAKPVGAEFVRPVVGYFCNLCQLIFIDEDEAKLEHCSTPAHYSKYQEKTGKDPWTS
ncbi:uncharacterized protein PAE49_014340 isoform 3-T3 [Odontesthes bonariensis]|uniref:uncharacterized protein LOC142398069 isoform X3 n=1 Tax=Odontesthes bonariensis TaxID=219752 RepID=UPI003F582EE1